MHPRLAQWWTDDPADPGRPSLANPDVQRLIGAIAPGAQAADLGGTMSLNARLEPGGQVLRVHQPFVSPARLLGLQRVRQQLARQGLRVPVALRWQGAGLLRYGRRWAELEPFLSSERLPPVWGSYLWLFGALGRLHRALAKIRAPIPRPLVATYAPPGTLRRWLPVTAAAVQHDPAARGEAQQLRQLVQHLRAQWVPAARLPQHLVHGDIRLSNVRRAPDGAPIYFDFGFLARRPRIHDLAYALAYMVLALNGPQPPEDFAWQRLPQLIDAYETEAHSRLKPAERAALIPYTAAVPLYHAAIAGLSNDPLNQLRSALPFVRLSAWLLGQSLNPSEKS